MEYDVAIIGGGPAGLTAAIYAGRANKKTVFIEKSAPGGKMVKTNLIENWTGDESVSGPDLSMRMYLHAQKNSEYKYGDVKTIKHNGPFDQEVFLASGETVKAKSVIIATGTIERVPEHIEGIRKFENKGVSYCAICDGPLHKGEIVSVIGGGNSAAEEAIYLSSVAKEVHVFVRKPEMRAEKKVVKQLTTKPNVVIHYNSTIEKLNGENSLNGIVAKIDGKVVNMETKALFPYIGLDAVSDFAKDLGITNEAGYIKTNEEMETKVPGIYAVGDVRVKSIRQIATAVADGAIAGKNIANR